MAAYVNHALACTPVEESFEKRINHQDRVPAGPFRVTQIWHELISSLKQGVELKKRRVKMKQYDDCFKGSEAVDIIHKHLLLNTDTFTSKDLNREKACKVCQLFMDDNIFESVGGHDMFEDSGGKFFRFTDKENDLDLCTNNNTTASDKNRVTSTPSRVISNPLATSKHSDIMRYQEILDLTGAWRRNSSQNLKTDITPTKSFPRSPSLPSFCQPRSPFEKANPALFSEEIRREVALNQLLMIVEIPMLDGILGYDSSAVKSSGNHFTMSNLAFRRKDSSSCVTMERVTLEDTWVEKALNCLECHPHGMDILDHSLSEDTSLSQRLRMFQAICDHYTHTSDPLWCDKFVDVQLGIYNLLMKGMPEMAVRALKLSMVLLSCTTQEEMKRLLQFMKIAAEDTSLPLSIEQTNRQTIIKKFTSTIINNKMLGAHQAGQLVSFMMDHSEEVFIIPDIIEQMVAVKVRKLLEGKGPALEVSYCQKISIDEFEKQQSETTESALVALTNTILDDRKMQLKEKKKRLAQLQKYHPELYEKHFPWLKL